MDSTERDDFTFTQRLLGLGAGLLLKLLLGSLRWDKKSLATARTQLECGSQRILAFWHGRLIGMTWIGGWLIPITGRRLAVLISQHGDGRLIAGAVRVFGMDSVAGSSSKGGREAVVKLLRVAKTGSHLAITPDGPKGPKHECKLGVVALARRSGLAILPMAVAVDRKWQLGSWDGMIVPKPFARAVVFFGDPIAVGPEEDLESARLKVQGEINSVTARADNVWAPV